MKRKILSIGLGMALLLAACGGKETVNPDPEEVTPTQVVTELTPTEEAVVTPTEEPVAAPTEEPVAAPTEEPVAAPTEEPVAAPTEEPVATPTEAVAATPEPTPFVPENPDVMPTDDEEVALSLVDRVSVFGQGIGTDNADGSVTFSGGSINKCMFPLPSAVKSETSISVTMELKFASAADSTVRVYLTNQAMENCTTEIYYLSNDGKDTTKVSFELQALAEASGIMLASSSFDTYFQDITLLAITVGGDIEITDTVVESPSYTEAAASDWYQTLLSKAQMNLGNNKRLKAIIEKAQAGEQITIASIGGSITEGAGALKYKECYAYQTYESFKNEYGAGDGSNVNFVNAGVGGTPSTFGLLRYNRDIVSRVTDPDGLPDIVMVEYSVNDGGEPTNHGCYESLIKQILQQPNEPVVILVFAVFPSGYNLQDEMKKVGTTYDLMMVSIKDGAFPYVGDKWTTEEFFYDVYHPTTLGHKVMADCIFNTIKAAAEQPEATSDINLDVAAAYSTDYIGLKTIFKDSYEDDINLSMGSFSADDGNAYQNIPIGKVYAKNFYHTAGSGNESLKFEATCKNFLISYRAVNDASYGAIDVYVDGKKVRTINGNTGSWGQSVTDLVFADDTAAKHTIEIKMAAGDENKKFTITCMGYTE